MRIAVLCGLLLGVGCTAEGAVGVATESISTCPSGNGLYCADSLGLPASDDTLYRCTSGQLTVEAICFAGCQTMPPGLPDRCRPGACPDGDGLYCGLGGFAGCSLSHRCLDTSTLYRCTAGAYTVVHACANGCDRRPPGVDDQCLP